jgi:CDP-diacylglycerol--glycerol-3-phosphate 3-phosphatidyltransferase
MNDNFLYAGIIFAYCSFSDVADGKIARNYDLVSGHGNYNFLQFYHQLRH